MPARFNSVLLTFITVAAGIAWIASLRVPVPAATTSTAHGLPAQVGHAGEETVPISRKTRSSPADPFWPPVEVSKTVIAQLVPIAPAPPPRPVLPFKFFGRMTNPDGRQTIFISRENEQFEVKPDALLEGQYKVISISDAQIVFEHIASGEKLEMVLPPAPRNNSGSGS